MPAEIELSTSLLGVVKNDWFIIEPVHEKTNNLHMRKQRRRSAVQ